MEEYALKAYQLEVKGVVNQSLVSLELGYGEGYSSEEQRQYILDNFSIDETRERLKIFTKVILRMQKEHQQEK